MYNHLVSLDKKYIGAFCTSSFSVYLKLLHNRNQKKQAEHLSPGGVLQLINLTS